MYELKTLHNVEELDFSSPVSLMQFTADGKNLFVVTSDQNAYLLNVSPSITRTP